MVYNPSWSPSGHPDHVQIYAQLAFLLQAHFDSQCQNSFSVLLRTHVPFRLICKYLVSFKRDNYSRMLIHHVVRNNDLETCKLLLQLDCDMNAQDSNGLTPLHEAAKGADLELIEWLLSCGVDPSPSNKENMTPLHMGIIAQNLEVCQLMIEHGCSLGKHDSWYKFRNFAHPWIMTILPVLLENGLLAINQRVEGNTMLHYAVQMKRTDICQLLLENGANLHICDETFERHVEGLLDG